MVKFEKRKFIFFIMTIPFIFVNIYMISFNLTCNPIKVLMIVVDMISIAGISACLKQKLSS